MKADQAEYFHVHNLLHVDVYKLPATVTPSPTQHDYKTRGQFLCHYTNFRVVWSRPVKSCIAQKKSSFRLRVKT